METNRQNKIIRRVLDGIHITEFCRGSLYEILISAVCDPNEDFSDFLRRVQAVSISPTVTIISQEVFGPDVSDPSLMNPDHPVTWIKPPGQSPHNLTGTQIWAIRGTHIKRITQNHITVGSLFEDEHARYCRLGGLGTSNPALSREVQTQNTFVQMQQLLTQNSMDFHHVARTWFFNNHILDWYDDFNRVRTQYFRDHDIVLSEFPASTGIGAPNPSGSALTAGLLAIDPKTPETVWKTIESPLQDNPAEYGSSFSRAAELITPDEQRLFISGTASISNDGQSVHPGDIRRQIELTMEVVQSILKSRGMNWNDVIRSIVYFKKPHFADSCQQRHKYPIFSLPYCAVFADICREDLLFEIELDAVIKK